MAKSNDDSLLISSISSKGQTTIPAKVREILGVKPGDKIVFEVKGGKISLNKYTLEDRMWLLSVEKTLADEWGSDADDDL